MPVTAADACFCILLIRCGSFFKLRLSPLLGLAQVFCFAVRRGSGSARIGGAATGRGSSRPWLFGRGTASARRTGGRSVARRICSGGTLCVSHGDARSARRRRRRRSGRPRDSAGGSAEQLEAESLEEGRRRRRVQQRRMTAAEFSREHGGAICESFVEEENRERTERREGLLPPIYSGEVEEPWRRGLTVPHDRGNCSGKSGNRPTHDATRAKPTETAQTDATHPEIMGKWQTAGSCSCSARRV